LSEEPTQQISKREALRVSLIEPDLYYVSAVSELFSRIQHCKLQILSSLEDLGRSADPSSDITIITSRAASVSFVAQLKNRRPSVYIIVLLPGGAHASFPGADECILKDEHFSSRLLFAVKQAIHRISESRPEMGALLAQLQIPSPNPEPRTLQVGHTILHYRIVADIGQGGMGEVYEAEDLKLGRSVAIKVLPMRITRNEDAIKRLVSEARAASALNHPNIVTIHSIEEWQGIHFIVMEHIDGHSVGAMLKNGPLPLPILLDMGILVSEALEAAHGIGVIHRDIKPGNIMITDRERVKLLDFGLAKKIEALSGNTPSRPVSPWQSPSDLTEDGQVMGTVSYMSPEQMRGEALDGRSDIFSLGCVLYEAATGKVAFPGPAIRDVMHQIVNIDPPPPGSHRPELPPEFDVVIARAMEKDREMRFASAAELADALNAVRASLSEPQDENKEKVIAVLYFENLSGSFDEEYFRDGMTEDIILELAKIRDLRVLPRSAVAAYRDKEVSPKQVGRQLRASFVLIGSVRREGARARITTQLIDAMTGHSLWAQRYDRELKDILDIQEEIARSIASALRITLTPQEEKAIATKPAGNTDAYDYYLRGRNFVRRATHADLEFAMQMFECAIDLEKFALAYAGLSAVCALFYDWYEPQQHWIDKGMEAADAALALEPGLPEGLASRARLAWSRRKYEEAIRFAKEAIERKADCEGAYWTLGQALFSIDRWQEVADLAPHAIAASGDDYNVYVPLINAMGRLGKDDEARRFRKNSFTGCPKMCVPGSCWPQTRLSSAKRNRPRAN
jgi:non-specific serine/threonine protein kinase